MLSMIFRRMIASRPLVVAVVGLLTVVAMARTTAAQPQAQDGSAATGGPLPGTTLYEGDDKDLPAATVGGIHRFLEQRTLQAKNQREKHWRRDRSSPQAYAASVEPNRQRLKQIIGVVDERHPQIELEYIATTSRPAKVAENDRYAVYAVRWPVLGEIYGEGLLLQPKQEPRARVVVLPDADQTPEALAGLVEGSLVHEPLARRLAESGCQVIIPVLISRDDTYSGNALINRYTNQPHREWIYRQAFQLGRHVIGFEAQKVLAAVDWYTSQDQGKTKPVPIGVAGYGEGGLIAFYAAAVDTRIDAALVSGYFGPREGLAEEPIYRDVWALLHEFGDAEIASLVAPRRLIVEAAAPPQVDGPPAPRPGRQGAAPGAIPRFSLKAVRDEFHRAQQLLGQDLAASLQLVVGPEGVDSKPGSPAALKAFVTALGISELGPASPALVWPADRPQDDNARQERQVRQMERHIQQMMELSPFARAEFFWQPALARAKAAGTDTLVQAWPQAVKPLREYFWNEFIGRLPDPTLPANARSRKFQETKHWTGYLVVLDVWPEVISWGYLLLPKDLRPDERRPVVVCQHGISGTPASVLAHDGAYRALAPRLAERGFVVYVPYNPNAAPGDPLFRQLQRKAHPLKCSIFSVITGQHQRILQWLSAQPFVDARRIGFYGLSYGGKTAMRVPALLDGYALSICSGDFNEWVRKIVTPVAWTNVAPGSQRFSSYMFTREYEIHEFNQGNTFNYAEMAALIAPRPFMVERGHRDLVGSDEWVAFEYATVRRFYTDLGIADRTEIEFFDDGHVINAQASLRFLHRHLNWPEPQTAGQPE